MATLTLRTVGYGQYMIHTTYNKPLSTGKMLECVWRYQEGELLDPYSFIIASPVIVTVMISCTHSYKNK
jgi:hypothetical protein